MDSIAIAASLKYADMDQKGTAINKSEIS